MVVLYNNECFGSLKATFTDGGEADRLTGQRRRLSPKPGREKFRGEGSRPSLLGDRNSLEAADGSSKPSDDERSVSYVDLRLSIDKT